MAETARQIADDLRARISDDLMPGDRLPGEPALVRDYGVAKETARRALTLLVDEGLAVRRRGSGTYVREFRPIPRVANKRLAKEGWGAGKSIWGADLGDREFTVTDLEVYESGAPRHIARLLELNEDELVIVRSRRYVVEGEPVQQAISYLPAKHVRDSPIAQPDPGEGGIYRRLADLGLEPVHFTEELRARMPSQEESTLLAVSAGTPVVDICRTAFTADGRPVEVNQMLLNAGVYVMRYHLDS
ncbi:GntR family transcriptional regulator [Streptomyces reniochalinae]|uniref:GntR family transcriptional regulator n=1 Tax=Streptomyces reniochalinae TaxID=2250578 RepID=A0A367F1L1_9ACTN|nr:GntR family transcriptional regulator [Streptomyces reniochalinae]RCG24161.1 GntR family transcriptional regulator [Streptomyces reniochalinae]